MTSGPGPIVWPLPWSALGSFFSCSAGSGRAGLARMLESQGPGAGLMLRTERLVLSPLSLQDATALLAYRSLPSVYLYQSFQPQTLADAESFIRRSTGALGVLESWYQLGLYRHNALVGDLGIHFLSEVAVELGYTLDPAWQGQGLAREAVGAVIGFIFGSLRKERIEAELDARNTPSLRLLEALGFQGLEASQEGELHYLLRSRDWERRA